MSTARMTSNYVELLPNCKTILKRWKLIQDLTVFVTVLCIIELHWALNWILQAGLKHKSALCFGLWLDKASFHVGAQRIPGVWEKLCCLHTEQLERTAREQEIRKTTKSIWLFVRGLHGYAPPSLISLMFNFHERRKDWEAWKHTQTFILWCRHLQRGLSSDCAFSLHSCSLSKTVLSNTSSLQQTSSSLELHPPSHLYCYFEKKLVLNVLSI